MRRPPELAICHPACKQGEEVSSVNAKIIIVKEGKIINQLDISSATDHHPPISITLRRKSAAKFHRVQNQPRLAPPGSPAGFAMGSSGEQRGAGPAEPGGAVPVAGAGSPRHPGNETPGAAARPPFSLLPRAGGPERKETRKRSAEKGSSVLPLPQRKCNSEVLPEPPPPASAWRPHARRVGRGEAGPGFQSLPRWQPRRRSLRAISADSYMGGGQRLRRGIMK